MLDTLVVPDLHIPYQHPDAIDFLVAVRRKYKLTQVYSVGDEVDLHSTSYHDHDPDLRSPGDEMWQAKDVIAQLYKRFPKMKICESNHGSLHFRKAFTAGLPKGVLKTYAEIWGTPGWTWLPEIVDHTGDGRPVILRHSVNASVVASLRMMGGACYVAGHHHGTAETAFLSTPGGIAWGMQTGCLVDDTSRAMAYNKLTPRRPIMSCGVIISDTPLIVPMRTDKHGRWVGSV